MPTKAKGNIMTKPASPATPAPGTTSTPVTLPKFEEVDTPTIGRAKQVNPYVEWLKTIAIDVKGFSKGYTSKHADHATAKAHANLARRAGKELGLGISAPLADGDTSLTIAVVPKRERKADGSIGTPDAGAPAPESAATVPSEPQPAPDAK